MSEKMVQKYLDRVRKGHDWLSKMFPGWENEIDLDSLVMNDNNSCLLTQAFGIPYTALRRNYSILSYENVIAFGFTVDKETEANWSALEEAQRRLIRQRQRIEANYGIAR